MKNRSESADSVTQESDEKVVDSSAAFVVTPPRQRRIKWWMLCGMVVLAGLAVWVGVRNSKSDQPSSTSGDTSKTQKNANVPITDAGKKLLTFSNSAPGGRAGMVMYYQPSDRFVNVPYDENLSYFGTAKPEPAAPMALQEFDSFFIDYLKAQGFSAYEDNLLLKQYYADTSNGPNVSFYRKDNTVCVLNNTVDTNYVFNAERICVDTNNLPTAAAAIEPFYRAYFLQQYGDSQLTSYTAPNAETGDDKYYPLITVNTDVKKSVFEGYEYVYGGIGSVPVSGGASAVFFREVGGDWQFGMARQAIPACSDFRSNAMRHALAEETCYDESIATNDHTSTVKAFYKL